MTDTPFVTILPYSDALVRVAIERAARTSTCCLPDLLVHLFLRIEVSRVISPNNLDVHTVILVNQSRGCSRRCIHTFDSSPTINGSLTLATLPLVMMTTLKIPSYSTGL